MSHRKFKTGAVRGSNHDKPNFLDYLDPAVLMRYGVYMKENEGKYGRGNWKKGIPADEYLESLFRHLMKLWLYRTHGKLVEDVDHASAILFNIIGFIYEEEKHARRSKSR